MAIARCSFLYQDPPTAIRPPTALPRRTTARRRFGHRPPERVFPARLRAPL